MDIQRGIAFRSMPGRGNGIIIIRTRRHGINADTMRSIEIRYSNIIARAMHKKSYADEWLATFDQFYMQRREHTCYGRCYPKRQPCPLKL